MRGLTHRWRIAPHGASEGGVDLAPLAARILASRGLGGAQDARRFLEPKMTALHDPGLLPGLERAAERILAAANAGERIVIYGDYDVDGVTATAILKHTLALCAPHADVQTYVPHRIDEGYGLSVEAINALADDGARVIVSVDCGVTAVEPALAAKARGVDLIITDHHNPPADAALAPDAFAIVHPRLEGSAYPFGELAGAGVAFKLAWRLLTMAAQSERLSEPWRTHLMDMLALCAMGTVADVVPLVDENRVIARYGLARLKSLPLVGMRALIEASGLSGEKINSEEVGFRLGPRLNACGRLGHAAEAVELLLTQDATRAMEIATALCALNDQRRAREREMTEMALEMADAAGMSLPETRAVVLAHPEWHPGVIGIVCSRVVGQLNRPTILLQDQGEVCKGSCRSVDGFAITDALGRCTEHLETFGGHDMAAGLSLRRENLDTFREAFTAIANAQLEADDLLPTLDVDCEATMDECTTPAAEQIERMAPFGRENPRPVVLVRGARLSRDADPLGSGGRHIAMHVGDGRAAIRVVGWNWGEKRPLLRAGAHVDVVIEPKINAWRGRVSVEGVLKDVRVE
jgi:single-stranded-DNA-specific exonuclease